MEALVGSPPAFEKERGPDGRRLFDLPVESSSVAKCWLGSMTMDAHLREHGFDSWRLRSTVDYACRDDYGCTLEQTPRLRACITTWPAGWRRRMTG